MTTASNAFILLAAGQNNALSDITDYRDHANGTVNISGGTVEATRTNAYIVDGVRSRTSAVNAVQVAGAGSTTAQSNVVKF